VQVGFVLGDAVDELFQVVAGEGPVERGGDLVVVVLESVEALDDGVEAGEVVRGRLLNKTMLPSVAYDRVGTPAERISGSIAGLRAPLSNASLRPRGTPTVRMEPSRCRPVFAQETEQRVARAFACMQLLDREILASAFGRRAHAAAEPGSEAREAFPGGRIFVERDSFSAGSRDCCWRRRR
jgi:hypothetical protein